MQAFEIDFKICKKNRSMIINFVILQQIKILVLKTKRDVYGTYFNAIFKLKFFVRYETKLFSKK